MIATITRVIPGLRLTTIVARESGVERVCFVWMQDAVGPFVATLCERAAVFGEQPSAIRGARLALTLKPKSKYGYEIEGAEVIDVPEAVGGSAHGRTA